MKFYLSKKTVTITFAIIAVYSNVFALDAINEKLQTPNLHTATTPDLKNSLVTLSDTEKFKVLSLVHKPKIIDLPGNLQEGLLNWLMTSEEVANYLRFFRNIGCFDTNNGHLLNLEHYELIGGVTSISRVNIRNIGKIDDRYMQALCENKNLEDVCLSRKEVSFSPSSYPRLVSRNEENPVFVTVDVPAPACLTYACLPFIKGMKKLRKLNLINFRLPMYFDLHCPKFIYKKPDLDAVFATIICAAKESRNAALATIVCTAKESRIKWIKTKRFYIISSIEEIL